MNILVFCPYYPPHIGGLESHSDEFNKYLSLQGVKMFVFTPRLPASAPAFEIRYGGVEIVRFPAFELFHNYPVPKFWRSDFWQQWNALSTKKYDIVISRTRFFFTSLMAWHYAKKRKLPWVHIEHGSDFAQFNGRLKTGLGRIYDVTVGRFVLCQAAYVIANSEASALFVQKLSGRTTRCQVIYRGANMETIESIEPRYEIQEKYRGKTIVAFLGRLIDGKGVQDFITAIGELPQHNIVSFIIGDGSEELRLKKLVSKYQLESKVIFFGNLPFNRAISILKVAHIVVNPSYTEGLPTAVTEAALCQKAIVATNVGGTREIISGDGDSYLVQPKNIPQLRDALSDLIDHPEKRLTFGQNAYQKVKNKFNWNESSKKYLEIFEKLKTS